jgi:hypothetical protein
VTVTPYQLAMWLAVKVIESTEPRIAPLAGLVPRNAIGGGGGGGETQAVPSELMISGRTQASSAVGGVGAVPPIVTGNPVNGSASWPVRFLVAVPE